MNTLYDRIISLCESTGITGGKLCKDIGIQRSLLTDLKMERKKTLSSDTLSKISEYFGVSVDSLLGKEQKDAPILNKKDERDYLSLKEQLEPEIQPEFPPKKVDLEYIKQAMKAYDKLDRPHRRKFWSRIVDKIVINNEDELIIVPARTLPY